MGVDYYLACTAHRELLECGAFLLIDGGKEGHDEGVVTDPKRFVESLRAFELELDREPGPGVLERALHLADHFLARHGGCGVWALSNYDDRMRALIAELEPEVPELGPDGERLGWKTFSLYHDAAVYERAKGDLVAEMAATPMRSPRPSANAPPAAPNSGRAPLKPR